MSLRARLRKRLGSFLLDVEFVAPGGITTLFGPSGSGKSQTLRCVSGLTRPDAGQIAVGGRVLFDAAARIDVPTRERRVGYVFQNYALFPHLDVAGNVAYGLHLELRAERARRVGELLDLVGLAGYERRRPAELSGGQQQRVALARALAPRPDLLLLDEPFAALDAEIRRTLRSELVAMQRQIATPVLFVTHDLPEAHAVADQIVVYDAGRALQIGPTDAVFNRPTSRRVAELTGTRNVLAGEVVGVLDAGLRVRVGPYTIETPLPSVAPGDPPALTRPLPRPPAHSFVPGDAVDVAIRPEHVLLVRGDKAPHAGSRHNVLDGRIVREISYGTYRTLYLRLDPPIVGGGHDLEMDLPEHAYEVMAVASRREWQVSLKRSALHLMPR